MVFLKKKKLIINSGQLLINHIKLLMSNLKEFGVAGFKINKQKTKDVNEKQEDYKIRHRTDEFRF